MYEIVTVGSAVVDILVKSDQFKVVKSHLVSGGVAMCEVYGGKTEVDKISVATGGGALNAAISFCRKGSLVGPIIKIGNDWASELILKTIKTERLGSSLVVESTGESGMSVVLIAPDGGRSILTHRGIASDLESNELDWNQCLGVKWFYISSTGGNRPFLEDVYAIARTNNAKVAFNPGRGELAWGKDLLNILKKTDVVFMNRMELTSWLELEYEDDSGLDEKIKTLGIPMIVMTEGNQGVTIYSHERKIKAGAFAVKSIDDTGAGDAFGSSFVWALNSGWDLYDAVKFASANAASVVQKLGAVDGLLDVDSFGSWKKKNLVIEESSI